MSVRKSLCFLLALLLCASLTCPIAMAAETSLQFVLRTSGEPRVGESLTAELLCTGNPGILSAQFTLAYDKEVLDCTDCKQGEALDGMIAVANPDAKDGATVAAGGVAPVQGEGVLATFTFTVLKEGDCGFALQNAMFTDGSGKVLPFAFTEADESASDGDVQTPTEEKTETALLRDISGHWAEAFLSEGIARRLLQGYPDNTCRPDEAVSRAQFVTFLWRSVGEPAPAAETSFTDVQKSSYYYNAVAWAQEKGYVLGVGDNTFLPDAPVSREEVALFLWRAAGSASGTELLFADTYDKHFTDSGETADWARAAVYWAIYKEIWCGVGAVSVGDTLGAKQDASRAEIVVMMVNYQDKIGE